MSKSSEKRVKAQQEAAAEEPQAPVVGNEEGAAVAPEVAPEEPVKEEAPKKGKKSDYTPPQTGVSSQGAAEFAPGRHPKERQIADKLNPPAVEE